MRLGPLSLLPLLLACSDGPDTPRDDLAELASDDAGLEQALDAQVADAAWSLDARISEAGSEACDPGTGPIVEFASVCVDAARDAQPPAQDAASDASIDGCVGATCVRDAAVQVDAAAPGGPCASTTHDCSKSAFFASLPDSTSCSFGLFGALEIRYRDCETCGKTGYLFSQDVVIMDCGGCSQIYAEGYPGLATRQAAGSCRSSRLTATGLAQSSAGNCIDVYTRLSSSADGSNNDGMHIERVCRCDVAMKQCISCSGGACDAPAATGG